MNIGSLILALLRRLWTAQLGQDLQIHNVGAENNEVIEV